MFKVGDTICYIDIISTGSWYRKPLKVISIGDYVGAMTVECLEHINMQYQKGVLFKIQEQDFKYLRKLYVRKDHLPYWF